MAAGAATQADANAGGRFTIHSAPLRRVWELTRLSLLQHESSSEESSFRSVEILSYRLERNLDASSTIADFHSFFPLRWSSW